MMQHPMQPHIGSYPAHNVTTELIQKYLDENKQLILAILDNQNLGKLNECAVYQAKLQSNLMYLAAIADSQPQPTPVHPQAPSGAVMPGGLHYMAHQQAQQQMAAQQQAMMAARNPLQYAQPPSLTSMQHHHQQQQQAAAMVAHHGMSTGGGNNIPGMVAGSAGLGESSSLLGSAGFPDFVRAESLGEDMQGGRGLGGGEMQHGSKTDGATNLHTGNGGNGSGQGTEEPEASYLKGSEEEAT